MTENPGSSVRLHLFTGITAVFTVILIAAGGLVTSTGSGLAVPDWPLSFGMLMPPMVGGVFYEHGHRLIASFVGFLTVILAVWAWRVESRIWVKRLAGVALGVVILQGLLGGLTVIYLLPTPVSVSHACLAQTFLGIVITLWLVTSKSWIDSESIIADKDGLSTRWVAIFAGMTVYIQLILGALVRHTESALVIPDFPLAFGHLFPPIYDLTTDPTAPYPVDVEVLRLQVLIQFMHRVWAIVVCASVTWLIARILRAHISIGQLVRPAFLLGALTVIQVLLGASVIWSGRAVWVATGHVVVGAGILSTTVVIILRCWRLSERPTAEGVVETTLAEGSAA
ncbi:MAG: COX15/CtaA family protein [Candidatus Latescibacterota bacterium]|nr:COX15/CtaA family protein [Candidatus Latescibacterota bacterium]